jgi:hypothetical protein
MAPTTTTTKPVESWEIVYENIREIAVERSRSGQDIEFIESPLLSEEHSSFARNLYMEVSDFWGPVFDLDLTMTIFLISDQDQEWWETNLKPIQGYFFDPSWFTSKASPTWVSGMGGKAIDGSNHLVEIVGHRVDLSDPATIWYARKNIVHEGTHWFQHAVLRSPSGEECKIETIKETCRDEQMSCWFHEGHASLYEQALASGHDKELEKITRLTRLDSMRSNPESTVDPSTFNSKDWLKLLRYGRTTSCVGSVGTRLAYALGLATMEIMHHDFGEAKINQWISSIVSHPTSRLCPAWIPAFEETFGETVEDWYFRSAIPYLIEVFSEDGKGEIHIDEENHPPTYYCSPEISDPSVDSPTVQGVPTGPEPMIECSEMASILEAQIWFDTYFDDYGDLGSLDSDMDGNACTREDTGGAVICSDGTVELPRACPQVNSSAQD